MGEAAVELTRKLAVLSDAAKYDASCEQLLRVPGLGVRSVERILRQRVHPLLTWADLKKIGGVMMRLKPLVRTNDSHPGKLLERGKLLEFLLPAGVQQELAF